MLKDSPVTFHADLRPKKVDSFVKKYLKRSGTAFNPVMDRRLMNIAGRILDPLGPLAQLWQDALAAKAGKTGLEPASVIELVRRAIALTGNASYCALVDRRKGLLASRRSLIRWYAANTMATATQPSRSLFGVSPGEARAPVPRPSTTTGAAGSPTVKGKPEIISRAKGTKTN